MDALLFAPVAVAIALTPGPNNFCGLNNGIRAGIGQLSETFYAACDNQDNFFACRGE